MVKKTVVATKMDDHACLKLLEAGGKEAERGISILFNRYALPFKRYFVKHGLSFADAEDLVQDAFVSIVRHAKGFRGECDIKIWLWKIARNTMLSQFRKKNHHHEDIDDLADILPGKEMPECASLSLDECVKRAFLRFSKQQSEKAEVLTLASVQGWSTKELAEFLGRTLGATREYVSQCRKHFKPYLEPCRDFL